MNIRGERIKCVSNFQAPELVIGEVYTASEVRTNTHGVWQVEVDGKWYAHNRFKLVKENEVVKQQFYVGDVVKLNQLGVEAGSRAVQGDINCDLWNSKYLLMLKQQHTATVSEPASLQVWLEDNTFFVIPEHLEVVERAWQKNTGMQPVEDGVVVDVKFTDRSVVRNAKAGNFDWCAGSIGDIVEWRLADSEPSVEEQLEDSSSHVAVGEELVATNVQQDLVNSPKHYAFFAGVEAIEIIASSLSVEAFRGYCMGNALKYRLRVGKKDKVEQEIAKADKYGELFEKHKHLCKGQ